MANGKVGQPSPVTADLAGAQNPTGLIQPLLVDSSGNLKVSGTISATNPSVGLNGQTAPTSSTEIGFIDGSGNEQGVSATNPLPVIVTSSPLPTGGATAANQVTGNNSLASIDAKTPALGQQLAAASQPVVLTAAQLAALTPLTTVTANQGSAGASPWLVSASSLPLPTGAATSALQTTGNTSLASIDTKTPALGAAAIAASTPVNIASNQVVPVSQLDSTPATQSITVIDSGSTTVTGFNNQPIISGTPTAGSAAVFPSASFESIAFEITGTWTGTLQFEVSVDGGTTYTPHGVHQFGSPNFVTTVTANFIASLNMAAKTQFRVRSTAAMTGTATIRCVLSVNASTIYIANSLKLIDSTAAASPPGMTIKAASTAALATDTAIVVALNPNNKAIIQSGNGTLTDNSGTTSVTPSTSTTVMATNAARKYLLIQNDSTTATIWINFTSAATAGSGSYQLLPGGSLVQESGFVSTEAVTVLSTVASVPYTAKQA